ncbi:MAG: hypothetical protein DPW18_14745 [Chloroflexi bacterium]|nr:hypothetical protein [Chloroflexota bacterium]MDL1942108.1 hypothetical protein [Chloroflexi bacterium CFX2]
MTFDYGSVLTRSLQITWKHKSYWLFSIVPMLVSFAGFFFFIAPVFFLEEDSSLMGLVIAVWLAGLAFFFIANFVLGTAGSASLTLGIIRVERGGGSTAFMDLLRDGFPYFWRSLGVIVLVQMTFGLVISAFFLAAFLLILVTIGMASICLQPVILLMTPLSFLVIAVMDGALAAVSGEDLGAVDAVKRSLQVVRAHFWKFVILALIVYFGASAVSSVIVFPAMLPAMAFPIMIETGVEMSGEIIALTALLFACLFFPLLALLSGVTGTFATAVLQLSYLRLSGADAQAEPAGMDAPSR